MPPTIPPFLAMGALAALAALASAPAHAQVRLQCESRNHQYQFCSTGMGITHAALVRQISGAACIEGSTWGWDRRGVWVTRGCAGVFEVGDYRPPPSPPVYPGRDIMTCESRDYQHNFCATDARIVNASVARPSPACPACWDATGAGAATASG